jgi:hypothetical protein
MLDIEPDERLAMVAMVRFAQVFVERFARAGRQIGLAKGGITRRKPCAAGRLRLAFQHDDPRAALRSFDRRAEARSAATHDYDIRHARRSFAHQRSNRRET